MPPSRGPGAWDAVRLTVFLSERDQVGHRAAHDVILQRAEEEGLAGATVWRGIEGFGASGQLRTSRFPDQAVDLPIVVELLDRPEVIEEFAAVVARLLPAAVVVREHVSVLRSHASSAALDRAPWSGEAPDGS